MKLGEFTLNWSFCRQGLILLPIAHIVLCSIFLFFYQFAFRHGLSEFYSASDIFQVSYRDIGPAYLAFLVVASIGVPSGLFLATKHGGDDHSESRPPFTQRVLAITVMFAAINVLIMALGLGWLYLNLTGDLSVAALVDVVLFIAAMTLAIKGYRGNLNLRHIGVSLAFFPAIFAAWAGSSYAEFDRINSYNELLGTRPMCKEKLVLRSLGDRFLAIDSQERRVVIDEDCDEKFYLVTGPIEAAEKSQSGD